MSETAGQIPVPEDGSPSIAPPGGSAHAIEVHHWNEVDQRTLRGERLFWWDHPRVRYHYNRKATIDGLFWPQWVVSQLGRPAENALELGCGSGELLARMVREGVAKRGVGMDLEKSRFLYGGEPNLSFIEADINTASLGEERYDLIYASQAFHHFEALEHILKEIGRALTPNGIFVLDEFVGPVRFQWTDKQLAYISQLLGLIPREFRQYAHGIEKLAEARSTVEEVVRVSPSEAIRSDEIPALVHNSFEVLHERKLGGTIQHLLYNGIVHNFPDGDPKVDHLIDCVDGIETALIEEGNLPSDFVLLIAKKPSAHFFANRRPQPVADNAPDPPARDIAALRGTLRNVREGIQLYQEHLGESLDTFRKQRAWRVMLAIRKAYDHWLRRGLKGKLGALPVLAQSLIGPAELCQDQELQFPSLDHYIPAEWPVLEDAISPAALNPPRGYDVVILAIIDFDFRYQRPQQIAAEFARRGHRVFWISPSRFLPLDSKVAFHARELQKNIWEVNLRAGHQDLYRESLTAGAAHNMSVGLGELFQQWAVSASVAMVQFPYWRRVALDLARAQGSMIVYDCMDEWDSFHNVGAFNRTEEPLLAREADVLVVTAAKLKSKFEDRGLAPVLARNGADFAFFSESRPDPSLKLGPRPVIGFFGAIADWFDLDLLLEVARMRPNYTFVLLGGIFGVNTGPLEKLDNVHLLGQQPYERIPVYLHDFDVCIIPFLVNDVTNSTDPVKLYEYLSLGKPVVSTRLAELTAFEDVVSLANDPADFAAKLDQALAEDNPEARARRIEFARRNDWAGRVELINAAVNPKFPSVSILIVTYNSERYLERCLDSIWRNASHGNYEVIVVDNASTDRTPKILAAQQAARPQLRCELSQRNLGFAGGNNLAAEQAHGDFIVFLNPDTIVTPGWDQRLHEQLRREPSIGIICPVTNFAGNEAKVRFDYRDEAEMERFAIDIASERRGEWQRIRVVPLFCGMMRRELFNEVGRLDAQYEIGMFEDDDLAEAIRAKGLTNAVAEDCFVHHFGQGAFAKLPSPEYQRIFDANRARFEKKWNTEWTPHRLRPGVPSVMHDTRFEPETFKGI